MRCFGRTKTFKRCKNKGKLFCKHHNYQIFIAIFALIGFVATIGGLYQDVIKPSLSKEQHKPITVEKTISLRDFFGLYTGNTWTYNTGNIKLLDYKAKKIEQINNSYETTVLLVEHDHKYSSGIASMEGKGKISGITHYYCSRENDSNYWFVYNKKHLFITCTYFDAENVYKSIKKNGSYLTNNLAGRLLYKYPFELKDIWYSITQKETQEGLSKGHYKYVVTQKIKSIQTKAGVFNDCFEITNEIPSSYSQYNICRGVGLILYNFVHKGSTDKEVTEIIKHNLKSF